MSQKPDERFKRFDILINHNAPRTRLHQDDDSDIPTQQSSIFETDKWQKPPDNGFIVAYCRDQK